jgi:hypothetical protein
MRRLHIPRKYKQHSFRVDIYGVDVFLVWGLTARGIATVQAHVLQRDVEIDESDCGIFIPLQQDVCIALRDTADLGVLAHECVHAANHILSFRNIALDAENDEPSAYLTAYLFSACLASIRGTDNLPLTCAKD